MTPNDIKAAYEEAVQVLLKEHAEETRAVEARARALAEQAVPGKKLAELKDRLFGTTP
jgi:hypothetical protein